MTLPRLILLVTLAFSSLAVARPDKAHTAALLFGRPKSIATTPLATLATRNRPWVDFISQSDQRQPLYLGATPFELDFNITKAIQKHSKPELPEPLYELLREQAHAIAHIVQPDASVEFEAWPTLDDSGQLAWVFARYRNSPSAPWIWLDDSTFDPKLKSAPSIKRPAPVLPLRERLDQNADYKSVFSDFLDMDSPYAKPLFGDLVLTDATGEHAYMAWPSIETRASIASRVANNQSLIQTLRAWILPQPPHFNRSRLSFIVRVSPGATAITPDVRWISSAPLDTAPRRPQGPSSQVQWISWPDSLSTRYAHDIRLLSGADEIVDPHTHQKLRLTRKNAATPDHQLEILVDYLESRYRELGISTERQRFQWRGIQQSNLIAIIKGSLKGSRNTPVLIADHIDTAYCEDRFEENHERISTAGADDDVSGTAALLSIAEALKARKPQHDIWFVHLTGEEFPADGLGSRHLLETLFQRRTVVSGVLLLDMIAWNPKGNTLFQINAGTSRRSLEIARTALEASQVSAPHLQAVIRERYSENSYLYNTDGILYENMGLPIVLFNERLSLAENFERPHYHQSSDLFGTLDIAYAVQIVKTVGETAARLADEH